MARILICDDSKLMLTFFERKLRDAGHEVVGKAQDGEECLTLFREKRPDLVLLDVTMPNKDGRETLADLLRLDASATIVMISALSDDSVIQACLKQGARAFIRKSSFNVAGEFEKSVLAVISPLISAA